MVRIKARGEGENLGLFHAWSWGELLGRRGSSGDYGCGDLGREPQLRTRRDIAGM